VSRRTQSGKPGSRDVAMAAAGSCMAGRQETGSGRQPGSRRGRSRRRKIGFGSRPWGPFRVCLVYCNTFVCIYQLVFNYELIRLKRFVSWFSTQLYN
jgi:hypothetical protein